MNDSPGAALTQDPPVDSESPSTSILVAEIVLPGAPLDTTVPFFVEQLGFRVASVVPADDPREVVVVGHGLRVRLDRTRRGDPGRLRLTYRRVDDHHVPPARAPNGSRLEWIEADAPVIVPAARPSFVLTRNDATARWVEGRAGMAYRDLVPERQNGRFIASHIRIAAGGPVPDYVHYHAVRFQMIYCYKGWVRVVYEDQGDAFVLREGDCVLQPPRIRHRVLDSSAGLEVIEIGCPSVHETFGDLEMSLPNSTVQPERSFAGQRFVRHEAATARWQPWWQRGFECRDTGIAGATDGLASVIVARRSSRDTAPIVRSGGDEFHLMFVLAGHASLVGSSHDNDDHCLRAGDCVVVPGELDVSWADTSADFSLLEVKLPA